MSEPPTFTGVDPFDLARREKAAAELKRFYKGVGVEERGGGFVPVLDGRPIRTPARSEVILPSRAAAELVAAEWERQERVITPSTMPTTRLVNSSIDGVARTMDDVTAEIVKFAGSDLLCYRAAEPADLVRRQGEAWDPVLTWAREQMGVRLYLAEGVVFVTQPAEALSAVATGVKSGIGVGGGAPFRLAALHVMTTLTGSTLLGLGVLHGAFTAADAWTKAHVDEDFQIERWGEDAEATARRGGRWSEMSAAAALIAALPL